MARIGSTMNYVIPVKECERFKKHGILFLPLNKILGREIELEKLVGLSGNDVSIWGRGSFQRKRIIISSSQPAPKNGSVVVKNAIGLLGFENFNSKSGFRSYSENSFGNFYVGTTLVCVYRSFR